MLYGSHLKFSSAGTLPELRQRSQMKGRRRLQLTCSNNGTITDTPATRRDEHILTNPYVVSNAERVICDGRNRVAVQQAGCGIKKERVLREPIHRMVPSKNLKTGGK
jgi:hypothetical protein